MNLNKNKLATLIIFVVLVITTYFYNRANTNKPVHEQKNIQTDNLAIVESSSVPSDATKQEEFESGELVSAVALESPTEDLHQHEEKTTALNPARDWLNLTKANGVSLNDRGYPTLTAKNPFPAFVSSLPKVGDKVDLPFGSDVLISGEVLYSDITTNASTFRVRINNKSSETFGVFTINNSNQPTFAFILSPKEELSYRLTNQDDGNVTITAVEREDLLPDEGGFLPPEQDDQQSSNNTDSEDLAKGSGPIALAAEGGPFQSKPGAPAVIFLNFAGLDPATNPGPVAAWGSVPLLAAAIMDAAKILETCQRVAEHFRPFNINVTDSYDIFNQVAANARMMVLITDTAFMGNIGGAAYLYSWGSGTAAFVFSGKLSNSAKNVAVAASHEVGHTLGLSHDGLGASPYHQGQNGWAPIMGAGYGMTVHQWSKGEYTGATTTEDDLAMITSNSAVAYRVDDHGNTIGSASTLNVSGGVADDTGIIERNTDNDVFSFNAGTGNLNLLIRGTVIGTNGTENVIAKILDASGNVVAISDVVGNLNATFTNVPLIAGIYYLLVDGGRELLGDGSVNYTHYGSIGQYFITGNIPVSGPLASPSASPSSSPSTSPSKSPSPSPSISPSTSPSKSPSPSPSISPSTSPSTSPSLSPSTSPSASTSASQQPSSSPIPSSSVSPSSSPEPSPSSSPPLNRDPSASPSASPSSSPSNGNLVCDDELNFLKSKLVFKGNKRRSALIVDEPSITIGGKGVVAYKMQRNRYDANTVIRFATKFDADIDNQIAIGLSTSSKKKLLNIKAENLFAIRGDKKGIINQLNSFAELADGWRQYEISFGEFLFNKGKQKFRQLIFSTTNPDKNVEVVFKNVRFCRSQSADRSNVCQLQTYCKERKCKGKLTLAERADKLLMEMMISNDAGASWEAEAIEELPKKKDNFKGPFVDFGFKLKHSFDTTLDMILGVKTNQPSCEITTAPIGVLGQKSK